MKPIFNVRTLKTGGAFIVLIVFTFFLVFPVSAVPAAPFTHTLQGKDGSAFTARQWGDEWSHGWETTSGYSILYNVTTKDWMYAIPGNGGSLVTSGRIVSADPPPGKISLHARPTGMIPSKMHGSEMSISATEAPHASVPSTGTVNVPVFLVTFNDRSESYPPQNFQSLLFGSGTNSMKDFYEQVSYGTFSISPGPENIRGWYTAPGSHDYFGQNTNSSAYGWSGTLVRETVAAADPTYNFAPYDSDGDCYVDAVNIIHQGDGEEASGNPADIWSHSYDLNSAYWYGISDGGEYTTNDACPSGGFIKVNAYVIQPETLSGGQQTVGVFTHEFGHTLGLPDLYDGTYASEGVGVWSLMGGGCWNSLLRSGDSPAYLDAWSRSKLGWVSPMTVRKNNATHIREAELYPDVYQFLENPGGVADWNRYGTGSGEYFLLENRQKTGFDAALPGDGLLIWHIDESVGNNENYLHKLVDLEEADGRSDLDTRANRGDASDPWYSSSAGFTSLSTPNSNLYNGSPSGVGATGIGASGPVMDVYLQAPGSVSADFITVTSPDGGETWPRGTKPRITWTSNGTVGSYVKIELLKGGSLIQNISLSTPNDGSFVSWTISTGLATGTDYQIRITSTTIPSITDTSNSNFTISSGTPAASITVTSPSGGETWLTGAKPTVTWTSTGAVGSYVKIELLKAGVLVQSLSLSTPNDGSYASWTIPAGFSTGTDYRIRITSTSNPAITDMSNSNFTISSGTPVSSITVASPNGGETWLTGAKPTVTWTSTGTVGSYVKIELLKAGALVQTLSISTPNDGTYASWTIPAGFSTGTDYQIRITSTSNPAITDTSNSNFTISSGTPVSSITVASPNGGETWLTGAKPTVTWTSTGTVGSYVKIELLKAGVLVQTLSISTPNDGTYASWTIPAGFSTGTDYQIRIISTTTPSITDTSNSNFTISSGTPVSSITVTSPNGGETWLTGAKPTVTWTSTGTVGSYVKIELLKAGALVQTLSLSTPNDGTYASWTIPAGFSTGTDYQIRITSTTTPSITHTSNSNFTISSGTPASSITVTSPNGGETWNRATSQTISWRYTGNPGSSVKIVLLKAGVEVNTINAGISTGTGGMGTLAWLLPASGLTGNDFGIRIQSVNQPAINDTSDGTFTIGTISDTPLVNFTVDRMDGNAPMTVTATDNTPGNLTAWNWSWGDGSFSTTRNATHTYALPGKFDLTLNGLNAAGSGSATKVIGVIDPAGWSDSMGTDSSSFYGNQNANFTWDTKNGVLVSSTNNGPGAMTFYKGSPFYGGSYSLNWTPRKWNTNYHNDYYAEFLIGAQRIGDGSYFKSGIPMYAVYMKKTFDEKYTAFIVSRINPDGTHDQIAYNYSIVPVLDHTYRVTAVWNPGQTKNTVNVSVDGQYAIMANDNKNYVNHAGYFGFSVHGGSETTTWYDDIRIVPSTANP